MRSATERIDRVEILEAALDLISEGVAILDERSNVLFWNKAAAGLTGHSPHDVLSRPCPANLYRIDEQHLQKLGRGGDSQSRQCDPMLGCPAGHTAQSLMPSAEATEDDALRSPTFVSMGHKLGHSVPGMLRRVGLRDCYGEPAGAALLFYPVEEADALPHGEAAEGAGVQRSQAEMEGRLEAAHHQWATNRMPFGLLWLTVDQAAGLRITHGHEACEAMLRTVEQTLQRQMKPASILGRWGDDEFLVLAHERTGALLVEYAQRLAGLARTADFRWWGDRVGLTVSIGASQACQTGTLQSVLQRARHAMHASQYNGGNCVTEARGD